jgi:hypothetical protein
MVLPLRSHDIRHHSLETRQSTDIYYCTSVQLNAIRLGAQQGLSINHDRIWEHFELELFQNMLFKRDSGVGDLESVRRHLERTAEGTP